MVVSFLREAAWQSTPKRSKTIAAQRLSSTRALSQREAAESVNPHSLAPGGCLPWLMLSVKWCRDMKAFVALTLAVCLLGCATHREVPVGDVRTARNRIAAALPPQWELIPRQEERQKVITDRYFAGPHSDAFILTGPN
jgi:hypothetical protein